MPQRTAIEKIIAGVGSVPSLIIHTLIFIGAFTFSLLGIISWDSVLLVLTTIVSLEAIYLAIFIQMSVNMQAHNLAVVSEDVEDIQEDIEEIQQDVEGISVIADGEHDEILPPASLEKLTEDVQRMLADLEVLKKKR